MIGGLIGAELEALIGASTLHGERVYTAMSWVQRSMETPDAARQMRFRVVQMAIMCICGESATIVRLPPEMVNYIFKIAFGNTAQRMIAQP